MSDSPRRNDGSGSDDSGTHGTEATGTERNDESEWRFGVDDVDEDGVRATGDPIEPGSPNVENVVFFALGIFVAVGVVALLIFG